VPQRARHSSITALSPVRSPPTRSFDFIAIGGGSAGFNAARVAASLGQKVAIVDAGAELGGLCILRGCMPSKTLLHSTDVLHRAKHAEILGLKIPRVGVDMKALQARKRRIIAEFADYRAQQLQSKRYTLFREQARFVDSRTLELSSGRRLTAKTILVATGSRVSTPPIPGLNSTPFWTSDEVLELDHVPASVIVLGGGIVACELAQYLARIGTQVTVIQRSAHVLREHSPEAGAVIEESFRAEGIDVFTGTQIESIRSIASGVEVAFLHGGQRQVKRARHLFNALGREPSTAGLDLAAAGVVCRTDGRIRVNRWQQTSCPSIYAGGDVCGPHDIVHLAVAQGELAARHAAGKRGLRPVNSLPLLSVVFTDPALASIGETEATLRKSGRAFLSASYPFNDHGKSILMEAHRGFVRVFAEPTRGRILGAEIVGPEAGELIHCFSGPLALRATVFDLLRAPWYHPTLAEIITYPLEEIADQIG
jgi:pyruvate/2-oxoglutarate dehydrogenase complex dihydrolipoamide dehydrogenase (E3) component